MDIFITREIFHSTNILSLCPI